MGEASMTLMAASMGMNAISSIGTAYSQAQAIKANASYRASVQETNAKIADVNAEQTLEVGDIEASRASLKSRLITGAMRAAGGGSGVDVNSGSTALARIGADLSGRIDELTIRNNAARRAWGYKTQGIMDSAAGQFSKLQGATEAQQTLLAGGMQAVSGAMSIYGNYMRWSRYMGGGSDGAKPFNTSTAPTPTPTLALPAAAGEEGMN